MPMSEPSAAALLYEGELEDLPDANGWVSGYKVGPSSNDAYQVGEGQWSGAFDVSRIKALPVRRLVGGATFTPNERSARAVYLAEQIRSSGVFSPIIVDDDGLVLEGQHRLEAAMILGMDSIPGVVLTPSLQTKFMEERGLMRDMLRGLSETEQAVMNKQFWEWQAQRTAARKSPRDGATSIADQNMDTKAKRRQKR